MDNTRTVGQKWLAEELDVYFLTLEKFTKGQSNRSILSKIIVYTVRHTDSQTDRQTDWHICEILIFGFRGSQKWRSAENGEGLILHKFNTFSDENVKIIF